MRCWLILWSVTSAIIHAKILKNEKYSELFLLNLRQTTYDCLNQTFMKRLALMLLAVVTALCALAQNDEQKRRVRVYGVAFYNLENLFDTINNNGKYDHEFSPAGARRWDGDKYYRKINNLASAIAAMTTKTTPMGPAIIGVSEIENRSVLEDLVKAEPIRKSMLQIIHHDSPDRRGVDVGLLYNPRMFRPTDVTNHTLCIPDKPDFRTRDQLCVTGVLGGDTISIIVNHWPSRLGGEQQSSPLREAAAALSKHIADSIWQIRPGQPVVIMGDLNDDPQNRSCAQVLGAAKNPDNVGVDQFYNPFWKMLDRGIGTLAYKGAWNLFDQIIVSGGLLKHNAQDGGLRYWKCQVNNYKFLQNEDGTPHRTYKAGAFLDGYSDHFPTEIFLIK